MIEFGFAIDVEKAAAASLSEPEWAWYDIVFDFVHTGSWEAAEHADAVIHRLVARRLNRPNPFAVPVFELADLLPIELPDDAASSTDTPPATPSGPLAAEIAVTGLRAPGAPSHTLLAHERVPATA